jgi:hypothetical protein
MVGGTPSDLAKLRALGHEQKNTKAKPAAKVGNSAVKRFASNPARLWALETPSRVKMNAKSRRP